jgi:hypothetical protein
METSSAQQLPIESVDQQESWELVKLICKLSLDRNGIKKAKELSPLQIPSQKTTERLAGEVPAGTEIKFQEYKVGNSRGRRSRVTI